MQYDAITVDTNIFDQNGRNLESGILAQLTQFKTGAAQFVLSEIVIRELRSHLVDHAKDAKDNLQKAIRKSKDNGFLLPDNLAKISDIYDALSTPEDAAKRRLRTFLENSGAIAISAELADMKGLVKMYFSHTAPFEISGKKKSEFPDAIALLSLESWAKENRKKILAVSDDAGWASFSKNSDWIDVEADLATALQKLQQNVEEAKTFISNLLREFDEGKHEDAHQTITDAIADGVSEMDVYAEATSAFHYEADSVEMTYEDYSFLRTGDEYDFSIVQVGKNKVVAKVGVRIAAQASCSFSLAAWDSIDHEYVPFGSGHSETEVTFDAAILMTVELDTTDQPDYIDIADVDLVDGIDSVNFGEIEADYGEEYEE